MSELRRVGRLLYDAMRRDDPRKAAIAVALDVLAGTAGFVLTGLWLKLMVDGAAAGDQRTVVLAGVALAGSVGLSGAVTVWSGTLFQDLHESSALVLMQDVMRYSSDVPGIEHHERPEYADRVALLRSSSRVLTNFVATCGRSISLAARICVTAVLLASVHPLLLALPLLALPSVWTGGRANRIVEAATEATAERVRQQDHLFDLATSPSPAKELRIFALSEEVIRRQSKLWVDVTEVMAGAKLRAGFVRSLGWLTFAAGYVGSIVFAVAEASAGAATPGDVLLVVALASDVGGQVAKAVALASESAGIHRAAQRLLWLRDYSTAARQPVGDPAPVPHALCRQIEFAGVSFRYPGTDAEVLSEVDVRIPAGSVVAVVGENGAGKSTLVKLLTRCYDPSTGRILVDGVDLRRLDVDEWRRRLSAGFQDYARFQFLLRESVGIGDLDRIDNASAVELALARSQAADLAPGLPHGVETQLGTMFEGGAELSEGQWQKVAIARSLMADAPLLLILDEPTSGLDATAEHALFERYAAAAAEAAASVGTVTVLISHRFSTVRLADLIVVIDKSRIVATGTHDELMAGCKLYAELYAISARGYRQ
ncbi:MAG: ABC transporter ATP-binding protein/permease [Actinobacteria bacterium]|nr:ABC transporter ATP-binding protein/permease [Actinomycetota bacterium]